MSIQAEIIAALKVQASIEPAEEVERSIRLMMDYLIANPGLSTLVLGISGGQDSTLVGRLAQMAVERLREETGEERYRFIAIRLPYGEQVDEADAQKAFDFIQPDERMVINIKAATDAMEAAILANDLVISDYNKGNIKARQRMVAQYAVAGARQGVVLGTDHAAESVTGFFTKFGDGAADLMPIWRLTKGQGRQLLAYLGAPEALYLKVPTADLEADRPMLADEEALGVSYEAIDAYLRGEDVSPADRARIEDWYLKSAHKRHLPITVFDTFWR